MARSKVNGFATVDDFRRMREFEPTEKVKLPKLGKEVLLRRPTPLWFMMHQRVPVSLSTKVGELPDAKPTASDVKESAQWFKELLQQTMISPECTDEILDLIDMEDALFISRWAQGELLGKGEETKSLDTFRDERESPDARPHG